MKFGPSFTRFILDRFRYVLAAVAVLVLAVGYVLVVGPEVRTVRQYGIVDFAAETKRLEDRSDYLRRLEEMLGRYDRLNRADLAGLATVLPAKPAIADLFVMVDALATESDLQLTSITIAPTSQPSRAADRTGSAGEETAAPRASTPPRQGGGGAVDRTLKSLDVSMTVAGGDSYDDFKDFLTNVEDSLRLFDIQSLTFSPPQETRPVPPSGGTTASTSYTLNLRTFFLDDSAESAS